MLLGLALKPFFPFLSNFFSGNNRKKEKTVKYDNLVNHNIFQQLYFWDSTRVESLQFGDEKRNKIFRKILHIQIDNTRNMANRLVSDSQIDKYDEIKFESIIMRGFNELLHLNMERMKEEFSPEIYSLVITGPKGFCSWNEVNTNYSRNILQSVCSSRIYENNTEKVWVILNSYQSSVDAIILSVEKTFDSFNGELSKIIG